MPLETLEQPGGTSSMSLSLTESTTVNVARAYVCAIVLQILSRSTASQLLMLIFSPSPKTIPDVSQREEEG